MSEEEQLQIQKDTLWEIHLLDRKIACLERKLANMMEAMHDTHAAWESGALVYLAGRLARQQATERPAMHLKALPNAPDVHETVSELHRTRQKRSELQGSFDRM